MGYGWNRLEMLNNGIDPRKRRAVFREKLAAIQLLWTEDEASFDGEYVHFTPSWSLPKPVQQPHPPVLIGAPATVKTFEDIATFGTGWYPMFDSHAQLESEIRELASLCGGECPPVTIVEMAGQVADIPWYSSEPAAGRSLGEKARRCADLGVYRMSVGVPADTLDRLRAALEFLAGLA